MHEQHPSRRGFFRAAAVGACVALPSGLACSSPDDTRGAVLVPEWQQIADGLESSNQCCFSSDGLPTGQGAGAPEEHLPVVSMSATGVLDVAFAADHPMTAEHWITTLYVRDQDGVVIGLRDFGQAALLPQFSRDEVPELNVQAPRGTTQVRAYSYCNLHQAWVGDLTHL